jgi:uracil-DNA glycosylase family 4
VFGEGSPNASLVFVGEGPGRDEDMAGRPFVGAAGQLLDKIIEAMQLGRSDVYICNVVKCRPPSNRVPNPEEQGTCGPFVRRQLEIIRPKVVVALGGTAASFLLGRDESLGRLRGRFHGLGALKVMPTYHPAYLLRKPEGKKFVWQDMQLVMKELGITIPPPGGRK